MLWNWNTVDACFLSSSWQILNGGMMAASCIGVALLVVLLEVLRLMTRRLDDIILAQMRRRGAALLASSRSSSSSNLTNANKNTCPGAAPSAQATQSYAGRRKVKLRVSPLQQLLRAVLHAVTFGVAYIVMLLAMYFNGYIIISIIIGAGLGKFLCDWMSCTIELDEEEVPTKAEGIEELTVCCQ